MHLPSELGLIVILVIVVILFGGGRIAKVSGELGTAIREFRRGLNGSDVQQPEVPAASETTVSSIATTISSSENESEETKG